MEVISGLARDANEPSLRVPVPSSPTLSGPFSVYATLRAAPTTSLPFVDEHVKTSAAPCHCAALDAAMTMKSVDGASPDTMLDCVEPFSTACVGSCLQSRSKHVFQNQNGPRHTCIARRNTVLVLALVTALAVVALSSSEECRKPSKAPLYWVGGAVIMVLMHLMHLAIASAHHWKKRNESLPQIPAGGWDLRGRVVRDDEYPFARGATSHIYKGHLNWPDTPRSKVAIKSIFSDQPNAALKQLKREMEVWAPLNHKNLVPLFGISDDFGPCPALISPLYPLGHVGSFLNNHPEADRKKLVLGVASGLEYLHAHDVVHGDLKVQNVLVDEHGTPCIGDFGISKIINSRGFTTASVGTPPYMAPELLTAYDKDWKECPSTTKSSDIYSFALLVLEVYALSVVPPKGRPARPFLAAKDFPNLRPRRIDYGHDVITDELWSILDQCWALEPQARPAISDVLRQLSSALS
ncbi:kinase-like domain-containing protein [Mycena epipterygia]|nr:kinase-like domain-containing protein [Mycena epipterygia]